MTRFTNLLEKLNNSGTAIIEKNNNENWVKFIANVETVSRTVYAFVKFDCLEGTKVVVHIPSGSNGYEQLAVKKRSDP